RLARRVDGCAHPSGRAGGAAACLPVRDAGRLRHLGQPEARDARARGAHQWGAAALLRLQRLLRRPAQQRPSERHGGGRDRGGRMGSCRPLAALALGYEVVAAAFDAFSTAPGGWDYTNLVAFGGTCAIARVLGLDAEQTREALAMTVVPHFASDEIESGDLNARGDLTMWKRFNGSDAVRNALQACLLAQVGVEG